MSYLAITASTRGYAVSICLLKATPIPAPKIRAEGIKAPREPTAPGCFVEYRQFRFRHVRVIWPFGIDSWLCCVSIPSCGSRPRSEHQRTFSSQGAERASSPRMLRSNTINSLFVTFEPFGFSFRAPIRDYAVSASLESRLQSQRQRIHKRGIKAPEGGKAIFQRCRSSIP